MYIFTIHPQQTRLTIIPHRLIGSKNSRISLSDVDIELVDIECFAQDSIGFDNGEIVLIDGEAVEGTTGDVDDSETISLAGYDVDDCPGDGWSTDISTHTID